MPSDPIVEFAQRSFGTDNGLPPDMASRSPVPDWLAEAADEAKIRADGDDSIRVEGRVPTPNEPGPAADGTTAEVFAFYLPFHFYRTTWGIYIRLAGVWKLARRLALPRKLPDLSVLGYAYKLLLEHERLHFCAEYAASRIEVVTAQSSYREYFRDADATEHEEALANAAAMRKLQRYADARVVAAVVSWMRSQPPGYRDFEQCMPPCFVAAERRATTFMNGRAAMSNRLLGRGSLPAEFLLRRSPRRGVPIYMVLDTSVPWVRLVKPFPKDFGIQIFVHSNDHKPPHIHIQAPPGKERTRYHWPELTPLRGDRPLGSAEEKRLRQYLAVHGSAVGRKITSVAWK